MLNENENLVFTCLTEQFLMLGEVFDGRLGDEDVDAMLDGVKCYWIVRRVGGEDRDSISWRQCVDGRFV